MTNTWHRFTGAILILVCPLMASEKKSQVLSWPQLLSQVKEELSALSNKEIKWLQERISLISKLQEEVDQLFHRAGGMRTCADCLGECCGCGRHHFTLTNLLTFLIADEIPPEPDFSKTCPYLGDSGCMLSITCRPYNCITFFCEQLEDGLDSADVELLRELDRKLRQEYLAVANRYPAASLRGIWIALEQLGGKQILQPKW